MAMLACAILFLTARHNGLETARMTRINQNYAAYMPLHYVLLFPCGDHEYHYGLELSANSRIREKLRLPQQTYYRYRLHIRDSEFSILHHSGRLFQQYVMDAYVSCDDNRTVWLYEHQNAIRADVYNGLADNLRHDHVKQQCSTIKIAYLAYVCIHCCVVLHYYLSRRKLLCRKISARSRPKMRHPISIEKQSIDSHLFFCFRYFD